MRIGFIGYGKMGSALAEGILRTKLCSPEDMWISDKDSERLNLIKEKTKINTTTNNLEVVRKSEIIFLAVKPQDVDNVLDEIKDYVNKKQLIISIAAGITTKVLEAKLNSRIARVMPNIACMVGEMAAALTLGKNAKKEDAEIVVSLLRSSGKIFLLEEKLMDSVTGLSGCGPAFFYRIIEAFAEAGKRNGLPYETALKLAAQTSVGAGKMIIETNKSINELVAMVATPGGATEEGLNVLENSEMSKIIIETIKKSSRRAGELAKG